MLKQIATGCALALLLASSAAADCAPPTPPPTSERPVRPAPPRTPPCATTNTCEPGEADRYNAEVKAFNDRAHVYAAALQAYVDRLNAYVAAAGAYAKCEVAATNPS
ncbi:hypothetical protein [Phenylobacterium sp.]|uniref:hypothetical protein n=1 Tax=Phenylobacterium sp. TaxID=1871053 RepID=UPI0025CF2659|nr:hypothetical protein [Phenylobacterium sp.]